MDTDMHVEVVRLPDVEGDANRGWQVDALDLRVDGERAGYLKMSHVPFHRLLQWYGPEVARTAVQWAALMTQVTSRQFLASGQRLGVHPTLDAQSIDWHWSRMARDCTLRNGPDLTVHVDRPLVDYIRIYQEGEDIKRLPDFRFRNSMPFGDGVATQDFRRRKLGLLLYVEGARWLAERGLLLHASGLQEPEAKLSWKSLKRRFPAAVSQMRAHGYREQPECWRTVLDGSALPPSWMPPGASSLRVAAMPPGRPVHTDNLEDLQPVMRARFEQMDEEAMQAGRPHLGGEVMPTTPRNAITAYRRRAREAMALENLQNSSTSNDHRMV
jgi:hypothetical protein